MGQISAGQRHIKRDIYTSSHRQVASGPTDQQIREGYREVWAAMNGTAMGSQIYARAKWRQKVGRAVQITNGYNLQLSK